MADSRLVDLACDAPELYQAARRWFLSQGERAVAILVAGLEDDGLGSVGHWRILRLLGELHAESQLPAVRKALDRAAARNDPIVLPGAMEALAAFGTPEAVRPLIAFLDSPDPNVVKRATMLLGGVASSEAIGPLVSLLTRDDPGTRYCAAGALARLDDPRARAALAEHLPHEPDAEVRDVIRAAGIGARDGGP